MKWNEKMLSQIVNQNIIFDYAALICLFISDKIKIIQMKEL